MKNKHNAFLSILMCVVLIVSVFVACDTKDGEKETETATPAGSIVHEVPPEPSYSKVMIADVELAEILEEVLGEDLKGESSAALQEKLEQLDENQKETLKDIATDKGYIVEEENGKLNIYESKDEQAPSALVSDIFNQASIKDPSNLTPEEITRLSQIAASNNVQLVTKDNGAVEIVSRVPATKVVTQPVTQAPNHDDSGYKTTIRVEIPSYNPPTVGDIASMGTTLPKTQLAKAGWLETFGDSAHHTFTNNATTSDGGVVAVGAKLSVGGDGKSNGFAAIVVKYDSKGNVVWKDTINSDKLCQLENVAVLKDGSIVAVGYTGGTEVDGVTDATYKSKGSIEGLIIKYSADGTKKFTKMVGGSGSDMIYGIAPTSDGGFVIGGKGGASDGDFSGLGTQKYKAFVMKLDANGNIKWTNALSSSLHSATKNIAVASNGDIYATIETVANDGEFAEITGTKKGLETTVLMKLNKDGNIQWKQCYHGAGRTQLYAVIATSDGCVIAGQYASGSDGRNAGTFAEIYNGGNQGTFDGMIIKVGADGKKKWMKPLIGFQNDYVTDIAAVPGGFALSGYTNSTNRDFALKNSGETDSFVYVISAYGDLQTVSSFGGSAADTARGICSNGKTVYICGYTNSGDGSFADASVKGADGKGAALVYQYNLQTN
ncbi:MAG: hypothetical protein J6J45_01310 [Clostridia bacterium]|nr:hypothetical protein [Clostridia bacterium]